ncbi:TVP38/TMEM64 family protein [Effusibacillus dendaii]|uniref:TVP38/TMEM64 family membrane protein n=1 Tax=Effusibacillus dendaii TaxID=2743772 RepID=A0A7I8D9N3_9BACL|nr:TVP38/TMEM64 family protein [Effusibacillus dendaii]BCJ86868.1 hypothetical protein skT53_18530 [Effusibacillus dendaii]
MNRKWITVLLCIAIIAVGYWQKDLLMSMIRAGGAIAVLVAILLVAITVFFPVVPFIVIASVVGDVFGAWAGTFITLTGAMLGSLVMFTMARYGFRQWAQNSLAKYPKIKEYEQYFENNAFASILFVRLVPVIPTQAVNILSGVSLVSWWTFFAASLLGKLPSNLVFNLAGSSFGHNKWMSFIIYGAYFLAITIAAFVYLRKRQFR